MISIPIQESPQTANRVMKISSVEDLNCIVYEVNIMQNYGLPQNPLDDGTFVADTIYNLPKKVDVRVLVNESDIQAFITSIQATQFSNDLFTVTSVANEVFKNLKIINYSKSTTADMVGKVFYLISFEEVKLVQALVESFSTSKNPGYSKNQNEGTKDSQSTPRSQIKGFIK